MFCTNKTEPNRTERHKIEQNRTKKNYVNRTEWNKTKQVWSAVQGNRVFVVGYLNETPE